PATRAHVGDASQEGPASRARPGDEAQGPGRRALARPGGESAARPGGAPSASAWVEREAAKVGRHYDEHAGEVSKAGLTRERCARASRWRAAGSEGYSAEASLRAGRRARK